MSSAGVYTEDELFAVLGRPAVRDSLPEPAGAPRREYMLWTCRGAPAEDDCFAVSGAQGSWFVVRVCEKHAGVLQSSLRKTVSPDVHLPYAVIFCDVRSYDEKIGSDWDELQRTVAEAYGILIAAQEPRIPGKYIVVLRRVLSPEIRYVESELLCLLGPPAESGAKEVNPLDEVQSLGEPLVERYLRWDCADPYGGCLAKSKHEHDAAPHDVWSLIRICDRHRPLEYGTARRDERRCVILVAEEDYRRKHGHDWNRLQTLLSDGYEVEVTAMHHRFPDLRIYLLRREESNAALVDDGKSNAD